MKSIGIILTLLILCSGDLLAQTDTLFWFAAPEVTEQKQLDRPVFLRISAYENDADVKIDLPANSSFQTITLTVRSRSTKTIDLTPFIDDIENFHHSVISNKGIRIQASSSISAYYEVASGNYGQRCTCNPEIFTLKGNAALGTEFFIPGQTSRNNSFNHPVSYSSFDIVATEDHTQVNIFPSDTIFGVTSMQDVKIVLQKGQTYSVRSQSQLNRDRLVGSKVSSDRKIAITIKDDLISGRPDYGHCSDLGGDQIVPVDMLGKEYIAIRGKLAGPGDELFVTATQNNTRIYSDGVFLAELNEGETVNLFMQNNTTFLSSDKDIYVAQLSGFRCEFGLNILPSINCTGSFNVSMHRSTDEELFVNLLVQQSSENKFLVNGQSGLINKSNFKSVSAKSNWSYAMFEVPESLVGEGNELIISNTDQLFHASMIHGGDSTGARFAYLSGFASFQPKIQSSACAPYTGSKISLSTLTLHGTQYLWTLPNGSSQTGNNIDINNLGYDDEGVYELQIQQGNCVWYSSYELNIRNRTIDTVQLHKCLDANLVLPGGTVASKEGLHFDTLQIADRCDSVTAYHVSHYPEIKFETIIGQQTCPKEKDASIALNMISGDGPFQFELNDKKYSNNGIFTTLGPGIYNYKISDSHGCSKNGNAEILKKKEIELKVNSEQVLTDLGEEVVLRAWSNFADVLYTWHGASAELSCNACNETIVKTERNLNLKVKAERIYDGEVCAEEREVSVLLKPLIFIPNSFSPNGDGVNDLFMLHGSNTNNIQQFNIQIFSRWGQLVFSSDHVDFNWDGRGPLGEILQSNYIYKVHYSIEGDDTEQVHRTGNVQIIR